MQLKPGISWPRAKSGNEMGDHDAFIKIEAGMMTKAAFTVLIKQNDRDNWGVGGKIFSDILPTGAVDA
jgi:hypothetical protein